MNNKSSKGNSSRSRQRRHKQIIGNVSGIEVGHQWETRQELSASWIHRPKSASVHIGPDGVYSILINSRFRGEDRGHTFKYIGPKVTKGQDKTNGNYSSFYKNLTSKRLIRVVRGAKKNSRFAPPSGFRFDGLYMVDECKEEKGRVIFDLRRVQVNTAPWMKSIQYATVLNPAIQRDPDICPYMSFIRFQSRDLHAIPELKTEQTKEETIAPSNTTHQPPETVNAVNVPSGDNVEIATPPAEEENQSIENITNRNNALSVVSQSEIADINETLKIIDETLKCQLRADASSAALCATLNELQKTIRSKFTLEDSSGNDGHQQQSSSSQIVSDVRITSEQYLQFENQNVEPQQQDQADQFTQMDSNNEPQYVGGMPLPMLFKEELNSVSGQIVIETPPQDTDEEYIERTVCEEEREEIAEITDEDWEEQEVDYKYISENHVVVSAVGYDENSETSQMGTQTSCEIDVEDGPKFAYMIGEHHMATVDTSELARSTDVNQENEASVHGLNFSHMKLDCQNFGTEAEDFQELQVQENEHDSSGGSIYVLPTPTCKTLNEAEEAIKNGNFQWYQSNEPLNATSESPVSQLPTNVNDIYNFEQTTITETLVETQEISCDDGACDDGACNEYASSYICQADSTSQLQISNNNISHTCPENGPCPFKNITLADLFEFALNQPLKGCACRLARRLPMLNNCFQHILQLKNKRSGQITGGEKKCEEENQTCDITHVESLRNNTNAYEEQSAINPGNTSQTDIVALEQISNNPKELKLNAMKRIELLWSIFEVVSDDTMSTLYSRPQPLFADNRNALKVNQAEEGSTEGPKSSKHIDDKVSQPSCYNDEGCHNTLPGFHLETEFPGAEVNHTPSENLPNRLQPTKVLNVQTEFNRTLAVKVSSNDDQLANTLEPGTSIDDGSNESVHGIIVHEIDEQGRIINPLEHESNTKWFGSTATIEKSTIQAHEDKPYKIETVKNTTDSSQQESSLLPPPGQSSINVDKVGTAPTRVIKRRTGKRKKVARKGTTNKNLPSKCASEIDSEVFERACAELCAEIPKVDGGVESFSGILPVEEVKKKSGRRSRKRNIIDGDKSSYKRQSKVRGFSKDEVDKMKRLKHTFDKVIRKHFVNKITESAMKKNLTDASNNRSLSRTPSVFRRKLGRF